MLRNRFFGAPFNLLKSPLRSGVIIGGTTTTFDPKGIKYTGGKYYAWGAGTGIYSGYGVFAESSDLVTWAAPIFADAVFNDIASNGTDIIIAGSYLGTPSLFRYNSSLSFQARYTPAGLSQPRYIEWCSGFSRFVLSCATNRGYSNDSSGTSWSSQSYIGTAFSPAGLVFVADTGRYYDLRIETTTASYIIYRGNTVSAQDMLVSYGGAAVTSHNKKFAYKAGATNSLLIISREVNGPNISVELSARDITSGLSLGSNSVFTSETQFAGAQYFPLQDRYIILSSTGQLSAARLVLPSTFTYNGTYNAGNLLSSAVLSDSNLITSGPLGLVALGGNRQIYSNP